MNLSKRTFMLAAALTLSIGAAFPQAAPAEHTRQHKRHGARIAEKLNLTDAQKEQAKAIREKYRASSQDVRTQMRTLHDQIQAARAASNTAEVDRLNQQREQLLGNAKQTWSAQRDEFRSILTADQQAKFDQFEQRHKGKRDGKRNWRSEKPQAE